GPYAFVPSIRNGRFASVPRAYTVSMCASSITFFVPVPWKLATTVRPIFSGVSNSRVASAPASTSSTLAPSAESRPAISVEMRSSPSRSRLPDSMLTRSLSVSITAGFSFCASDHAGSDGAASAPGAAHAAASMTSARRSEPILLEQLSEARPVRSFLDLIEYPPEQDVLALHLQMRAEVDRLLQVLERVRGVAEARVLRREVDERAVVGEPVVLELAQALDRRLVRVLRRLAQIRPAFAEERGPHALDPAPRQD